MQKASEVISPEHRARIEAAVSVAESKTSCEIVPVVATVSGRYDRAEDLVGLWCSMIGAVAVFLTLPAQPEHGHWDSMSVWGRIGILLAVMLVGFVVGAIAADRFRGLRRLFTPRRQMKEEVNIRARQLFFDRRIHHTSGASGVLVFVSLYERMAVVLGDRTVLESLGEKFPETLCKNLTSGLQKYDVATAICNTIQQAAASLETALPRLAQDVNELPDTLVLLD